MRKEEFENLINKYYFLNSSYKTIIQKVTNDELFKKELNSLNIFLEKINAIVVRNITSNEIKKEEILHLLDLLTRLNNVYNLIYKKYLCYNN